MFYSVGGGAVSIQSIVPQGANVPKGDTTDQLVFDMLNANSEPTATYYWRDFQKKFKATSSLPAETITYYGWYDTGAAGRTDVPSAVTIMPGEAFYMKCPAADVALGFSGEVAVTNLTIGVNNGYTLIGNPYPAEVNLQSLTPVGANVPDGSGTDQLVFDVLNANSEPTATYYWRDFQKKFKATSSLPAETITYYGWYDTGAAGRTDTPAVWSIPAGKGLYLKCPADDVKINIASPIKQ